MEHDYYKNFITVVEVGTITGAAEKIGIAQSALSRQIQLLENAYSAPLINKVKGAPCVTLTDTGKIFYEKAKAICSLEINLKQEILNHNSGYNGTLSIAVSPALSESFAKKELKTFHSKYKDVSFLLNECSGIEQEKYVLDNIVEIGITNSPIPHPYKFEILKTIEQKYYVFANVETELVDLSKPCLTIQDLADVPLCLSQSSCQLIIDNMTNNNIPINILSRFSHRRTTLSWVYENLGVAVFPTTDDYLSNEHIKAIPLILDGDAPRQTVYKLKGKKLSSLAERFISEQIR